MHGITYRDCWGCNKPRELCSFGYCGRPATHIGAGRPCCESDARVLADLNGDGTVTPIPYLADLNTDRQQGDRMTTETPTKVTAEQARVLMADLLDGTQHHDAQILITRRDKPAGLLVPPYAGVMPSPEVWEEAARAFNKAMTNPQGEYREAIRALGELLHIHGGHDKRTPNA